MMKKNLKLTKKAIIYSNMVKDNGDEESDALESLDEQSDQEDIDQ